MKSILQSLIISTLLLSSCTSRTKPEIKAELGGSASVELASELEESLFSYILDPWYPENLDTEYGGYISAFNHDWSLSENSQVKALVQQARHIWTCSFVLENYPDSMQYLIRMAHPSLSGSKRNGFMVRPLPFMRLRSIISWARIPKHLIWQKKPFNGWRSMPMIRNTGDTLSFCSGMEAP